MMPHDFAKSNHTGKQKNISGEEAVGWIRLDP